jgi:hypothetical protein
MRKDRTISDCLGRPLAATASSMRWGLRPQGSNRDCAARSVLIWNKNGRVKHGIEQAYRECAHANTRRGTEKQAFGGLDAQTAVKRRDGGGSTCQVMDQKIVLAAARRSGVS